MPTKQELRKRLVAKLQELFQLDQPDLDFGFYRIMHTKAEQVTHFLEHDLLDIIETAFGNESDTQHAALKAEYDQELKTAKEYGSADPENAPKVIAVRERLTAALQNANAEGEIYDHLYRFFERYYDRGDFISRRYYTRETAGKAAPFAIPYNGEEVKLHWANADQYYIKTAEHFTNSTFDLNQAPEVQAARQGQLPFDSLDDDSPRRVHFRIVEASEGAHGNVKASDSETRFFLIHQPNPVELNAAGELLINFEYRPDPEKTGQESTWRDKRNTEAVTTILHALNSLSAIPSPQSLVPSPHPSIENQKSKIENYLRLLQTPAPTEKDAKRPLLAKYVNRYTGRNTYDYFIHKDLGGFLRRELDFYIKNEVMRLDDIEEADARSVESYLSRLKVLRRIAGEIITFLTQLEEFQKKLWLKKKFVVETNYCITLDRIPAEFYAEIAANDAQRAEWVRLYAIDEIELSTLTPAYSVPLTVEFLQANPAMMVDTQFFGESFKNSLTATVEDFDEQCNGLSVHSDNFQALHFLTERYRSAVSCIYIDPPYNTGQDGFVYKDTYKSASWTSMISDRLRLARQTLIEKGVLYSSINQIERVNLEYQLREVFGTSNRIEEIIWVQDTRSNNSPTYSTNHEYVEVYAVNRKAVEEDRSMFRESKAGFDQVMNLIASLTQDYPPIEMVEKELGKLFREHKNSYLQESFDQGISKQDASRNDPWKGLYPYRKAEYRDKNGKFVDEAIAKERNAEIWVWREVEPSMPSGKQSETIHDPDSENYRFYGPLHPVTKKPCTHPKRGWAFPMHKVKDRPSFEDYNADHRIVFKQDETSIPQLKYFLHEVGTVVASSVIRQYADGEPKLESLFGIKGLLNNPKPPSLIERFITHTTGGKALIVDFFAGSGTTAEAAINANRQDKSDRRFILIEMDKYFDTVLKPRIAKVVYSKEWKNGKPQNRNDGVSHFFKYLRLESYEDTLNNLAFDDDPERQRVLAANADLRKDYMLRYLLDVETQGSQSLLNVDAFADPTAYTLKVKKPGSDEYTVKAVDLLETFNYLIGLRVVHIAAPQRFTATFQRQPDPELPQDHQTRLTLQGRMQQLDSAQIQNQKSQIKNQTSPTWWFRKVEGWVPADPMQPNNGQRENVLIIWRKLTGNLEEDNLMLDEWFRHNRINPRDAEFDIIYVNGSNNLANLRQEGDTWKVRLLEEEFMRRMWQGDVLQ